MRRIHPRTVTVLRYIVALTDGDGDVTRGGAQSWEARDLELAGFIRLDDGVPVPTDDGRRFLRWLETGVRA